MIHLNAINLTAFCTLLRKTISPYNLFQMPTYAIAEGIALANCNLFKRKSQPLNFAPNISFLLTVTHDSCGAKDRVQNESL